MTATLNVIWKWVVMIGWVCVLMVAFHPVGPKVVEWTGLAATDEVDRMAKMTPEIKAICNAKDKLIGYQTAQTWILFDDKTRDIFDAVASEDIAGQTACW